MTAREQAEAEIRTACEQANRDTRLRLVSGTDAARIAAELAIAHAILHVADMIREERQDPTQAEVDAAADVFYGRHDETLHSSDLALVRAALAAARDARRA